jgi:hypothetical protein
MTLPAAACDTPYGWDGGPDINALLEEGLRRSLGRPVRIAGVECRPMEYRSTHPIHRLQVCFATGEQVPVIFKQLIQQPDQDQPWREVLVYRRLLAGRRFGAPELYASIYDEAAGRYWLFLEDIGAQTLKQGPYEDWLAAVHCLARMHAAYWGRTDELRALNCLGEPGAGPYHWLARAARHNLELTGDRAALVHYDGLMTGYEGLVGHLVRPPLTLVHGDIFVWNILLHRPPSLPAPLGDGPNGGGRLRIRLIDWETAAIGLAAWDLALLLDGWGSDTPAFLAAYFEEFACHAPALDRGAFAATFRLCQVPVALLPLAWSPEDCSQEQQRQTALRVLAAAWRQAGEGANG